ncbi:aspartyl protease family protein [Flavobacterium hauense]
MRNSVLIVLLIFCHISSAQKKSREKNTIPFELTEYNNISVKAVLNEKDTVRLMFHTAASAVALTGDAVKRLATINFEGSHSVKSWGGENESRFSESNSIQIGELKWDKISIWEDENSGQQTDGKFGIDFFENKIIEIDFEKKVIVLYSELPKKAKNYQKLKLTSGNDMLFLEALVFVDGVVHKNQFLIHSGYYGSVLFDDAFSIKNDLDKKLEVIAEKELKDSFGNVLKTKKAILPLLSIGNQKLANVPVGFFTGAIGNQKTSILGGDILKRFNMIMDIKGGFIYLRANSLKDVPYSQK